MPVFEDPVHQQQDFSPAKGLKPITRYLNRCSGLPHRLPLAKVSPPCRILTQLQTDSVFNLSRAPLLEIGELGGAGKGEVGQKSIRRGRRSRSR